MTNKEIIERINEALKFIDISSDYVTVADVRRCQERLLWLRDDLVTESKESLERKVKKLSSKGLKEHMDNFDSYMDGVRKKQMTNKEIIELTGEHTEQPTFICNSPDPTCSVKSCEKCDYKPNWRKKQGK